MAVLAVVPGKECLAMTSRVFDAAKTFREVGAVFHCLELRLRIGVVVRGVGAAVALGHVQINQQTGHRLGAHGRASIGVQRERTRHHIMTSHGVGNELLGQLSALARRNQPAYDVAAEDVQDDVEVKASPFGRALELGDIPRPYLVGREGQQFGFGIGRVAALAAALGAAGIGSQQTVHGAHRTQVTAFIEQGGMYCRWSGVSKALAAQGLQHQGLLRFTQGQRRAWARWPWRRRRPHKGGTVCACLVTAGGATPQPHGAACGSTAKHWGEFMRASHQGLANFVIGSSCSSNAATFFWTSMTSWALLSCTRSLSRSRVTNANCLSSSRAGSAFGPRFLESMPVSSPAAYW